MDKRIVNKRSIGGIPVGVTAKHIGCGMRLSVLAAEDDRKKLFVA